MSINFPTNQGKNLCVFVFCFFPQKKTYFFPLSLLYLQPSSNMLLKGRVCWGRVVGVFSCDSDHYPESEWSISLMFSSGLNPPGAWLICAARVNLE